MMHSKPNQAQPTDNHHDAVTSALLDAPLCRKKSPQRQETLSLLLLILTMLLIMGGSILGYTFFRGAHMPGQISFPAGTTSHVQLDPRQTKYQRMAARVVAHMTLDEKLGQVFMVSYATPTYASDLEHMIFQLHAGGVILYQSQINTLAQVRHDITEMQRHARIPLLISTDEEGGYVDRLTNIYPSRPSARAMYLTGDPQVAAQAGHQAAHDLQTLGITVNLAPDSDVQVVNGPDQLARTFGSTPRSVIAFAGAYMQALQQDGVIACIKHFPGLGAATTDAHLGLPVVQRTKEQIYATELAPFYYFVQSHHAWEQPGMIMSTDVLMPAIDATFPAELSHIFITDILRKQFGYNGVIITDALSMEGIAHSWNTTQAAVMALKAGNDMILGISNAQQMAEAIRGLKVALQRGVLSQTRIDEAVTHILTLKAQHQGL
ncbi:glycoside hydrolase family 3 N-terminal domain-containing protein [Dictyobacter arantiisoli]|uniref:Glycoside hydrolase family 3 n=1 Tax=Dictyobacter arantiisoli TaxID=2014874 RepID=A0A5A5TFG5_9CHLR|nr:glycoside hydrolase family 3 N-terminal domain-containing protein [Dictyobacter arantiisoli]GCF10087.1 glycoside hydrolase family 3 [Dictyobacter arantiisoli]